MARSLLDLFRLRREQSRLRKKQLQRQVAYSLQIKLRGTGRVRSESLEPRNLLAAVPIALDDFAYFTNLGTDLVVTGSSNPGPVIANDTDIDLGSKTASVVSNPSQAQALITDQRNNVWKVRTDPFWSSDGIHNSHGICHNNSTRF